MRVPDRCLGDLRERGYLVFEGFLAADELAVAQAALWLRYPRPDEYFAHRAAHAWLGVVEEGVARRHARPEKKRRQSDGHPPSCHTHQRKSGLPSVLGKMSSMKKCTCPRMPTFLPVRSLMGTTASSPSWKYLPAQMMPGLTVPVVLPANPRSSGLLMSISTIGSCDA